MSSLRFAALSNLGLFSAFGLFSAVAHAQEPADRSGPRGRIVPPPAVEPARVPSAVPSPAGDSAVTPGVPAGPLGETQITDDINEPKLNGEALAGLYRKYTGKRIIVSSAASAAEFKFIQPATPQEPLTYDEASALLRKAAVIEGFVFVPDAENPNIEVLTLATGGVNPKGIGIDVYNENTPLPEGDAVISYVMTFNYLKPEEAVNIFNQVVGQFGAYGSISAVPNAAAVIITENTSLIRKLIELKREIDVGSKSDSTFISVRFSDVTELAATLNELFSAQTQNQGVARVARAPQPNQGNVNIAQGGQGNAAETPPVQIIPDPRTNRLFVMGHPKDLTLVRSLVASFDVETSEKNFLRRKLRFLTVSEFLPVASDALTRAFSGTGDAGAQAAGGGGNANRNNRTSSQSSRNSSSARGGSRSSGLGSSAFGNNSSSLSDGGSSGLGGGFSASGGSINEPNINTAPESVIVGRTLLVADNITNSIVVQGPPSGLEIISRLLDQIDVKAPQVQISTVFGQLTLGDELRTGVDWLKTFNAHGDGSGVAGSILGAGATILDPAGLTRFRPNQANATGFPSSSGLSLYGKMGSDLAAYVNLLQTNDNFTILSRPSVTVTNNQKGTISSGRRIAVPTNSFNSGSTGQSTNIEYRDVVLKLEVVPLVNSNKEVTLNISLISDDVVGTQSIEGIGDVPIISTRELITTATIPNRETVILGGLITENDSKSVSGIPILSSIPGLGRLFSQNTDRKERDELLIFLQPNIIMDSYDENRVQIDTDARYRLAPKARKMSDGPAIDGSGIIDHGKTGTADSYVAPLSTGNMKPSIRPIHRR